MADPRSFSVVRELSRRELERHQKRFVGVTASAPAHVDVNGSLEWQVDVRVGAGSTWAIVAGCTIAQWAVGIVSDMDVPVLCERSESGRVTVIARSEILLPDIVLDTYTHEELEFGFMTGVRLDSGGTHRDGFGHAVTDPASEEGSSLRYTWSADEVAWGGTDFVYGTTLLDEVAAGWDEESLSRI